MQQFHDTAYFSHLSNGTVTRMENKFAIFPRKGEVWAIYRNFSSEWSFSDLQTCEYHIGEVVQVYNIYKVLVLEKVSDYETVFKAQIKAGHESLLEIPCSELIRFSHQIPAFRLTDEKQGMLRGCWELDPKAVPICLFSSVGSTIIQETSFADQAGAKELGFGVGTNSGKKRAVIGRRKLIGGNSSTRLAEVYEEKQPEETSGQPLSKRKATTISVEQKSCGVPTFDSGNTAAHTKKMRIDGVNTIPVSVDEKIPSSASPLKMFEKTKTEFCNFDNERSCEKFKPGQVWALYCKLDEMPKNYAQIQSVESYPLFNFKLAVKWLESCDPPKGVIPWVDKGMPVCCGTFKVASDVGVIFNDSIYFSHQLNGVVACKNLYSIYPGVGEVWALYSEFCPDLTCSNLKNCDYCMVEVLEVFDLRWIIVSVLQRVTSFKTLFSAKEKEGLDFIPLAIPWVELYRFSHQVPAFRLTEARFGKLRGCWELDPRSMPVCLYSTN
ncbi:hypothetical protein MKW94_012280 [Papaver nudicaule]|uniref:DUF3444 domain-containing protein n=1 Tax=Papaver nudicaule TaxID=74823 RepID=A0AA41VWG3_PAPNU|nr:hypothetical protein [Papaver nudicaule]